MIQGQNTYTNRNTFCQSQYTTIATTKQDQSMTLHKRIGSTTYEVSVFFSKTSKETMMDKVSRLIKNEIAKEEMAGE